MHRYAVHDMDESAKRIYHSSLGTPEDHSVVLLAHNGPTGISTNHIIFDGVSFATCLDASFYINFCGQ